MNYYPNNDPTWQSQPPVPPPPPKPPKPPLFDIKARREYFKQYPSERKKSLAIGCGTFLGIFALCGICNAMIVSCGGNSTKQVATPIVQPTVKPTHQVLVVSTEVVKRPTAIPKPSPTPEPTPTPTPEPPPPVQQPAQPPPAQAPVDSGVKHTCSDFATHAQAQAYFVSKGGSPSNDVDGLDRDHDGIACENLR